MVGNGNTFEKNFKQAKELKLKNITFHHDVPLIDHPAIIEKADIFLGFLGDFPSVERVIPNKVYQGLALNKVVVTADAPVTRSVFKHKENMYLLPAANTQAFMDAILELQNNPTLRMKIVTNGYKMFTENFSPKAVGKQLLVNISSVIKDTN
jgi:glycosyltransferase involved in cell wall biosynthesis